MKRIGIVFFHNMRYAPFLKFYTDIIDQLDNIEYDIIYFNRDRSLEELCDDHHIPVPWLGKGTNAANKIEKAFNFVIYKYYVQRLLKRKKYDFLIVLMTTPGVLLERYLTKCYKGNYIFDIRDYTQEHLKAFFAAETRVVQNSALNVISSPGFKRFLPEGDYLTCHNFNGGKPTEQIESLENKKRRRPIRISYIGSISYEEQCLALIRLVEDDERFSFLFYGNESTSHKISEYAERIKNPRIQMMGPFLPAEKERIYGESNLVFNCYGNQQALVKYAISNKHYDGALYHVPVLVSPGTIMDELSGSYGYPLDLGHVDSLDGLYNWYMDLDEKDYQEYADKVITDAVSENEAVKKAVADAINL